MHRAVEAWFTLAGGLSCKTEPPAISVTWAELLPAAAPQPTDAANLERFADWLTLAELLMDYDPDLLARLGFPWSDRAILRAFPRDAGA